MSLEKVEKTVEERQAQMEVVVKERGELADKLKVAEWEQDPTRHHLVRVKAERDAYKQEWPARRLRWSR